MKIVTIVTAIVVIYISSISIHIEGENYDNIPNNLILERIEVKILNDTNMKNGTLKWKKVAYNVARGNFTVFISKSLNEFWIHCVLYYKYRQYQQYLIDVWVEYCRTVRNPDANPIGNLTWNLFLKFRDQLELNFDIYCPLYGNYTIKTIQSINVSHIVIPLLQAGRYRLDITTSERQDGPSAALARIYFSVSDLRVWF